MWFSCRRSTQNARKQPKQPRLAVRTAVVVKNPRASDNCLHLIDDQRAAIEAQASGRMAHSA
jgi:hypothetical protein